MRRQKGDRVTNRGERKQRTQTKPVRHGLMQSYAARSRSRRVENAEDEPRRTRAKRNRARENPACSRENEMRVGEANLIRN